MEVRDEDGYEVDEHKNGGQSQKHIVTCKSQR